MTFRAFLLARRPEAGAAGDFVRLARAHHSLTAVRSIHELRARLEDGGAPRPLYEAAQAVWHEYQDAPSALDA